MGNWPKGSQWRKWDLHVHSPASAGFSGDFKSFIHQLGNADCDVIGINDYFSVAGYKEVVRCLNDGPSADDNKGYREALEKLRKKTLLPVVECRMTNVLLNKDGKSGTRINFHLIFDPSLPTDDIETFIKSLQAGGSSIGSRYSDKGFLRDQVAVDFKQTCQTLRDDGNFKERFLVWLPYDEYGGIDDIDPKSDKLLKERLILGSDILGSSNKNQADFFLWKNTKFKEEKYREWFKRRKPCIKGSDSHNVHDEIGRLKDDQSKPTDKYCWIKSDPTFSGLRQITNEPEDRVYIGALPPKMVEVAQNPTRYLKQIKIGKVKDAETAEVWFASELPLNFDMISIIGNKGSGKSALADIIALVGNSHCDLEHFSFLTKDRFCERNGRLAKQFEATITWNDGTIETKSLDRKPDTSLVERVKYIPQSYLERVCTETDPSQKSEFQRELRKVIFSHISEANKLGKGSLDDLIEYKTEELAVNLVAQRQEVSRLNGEIVKLEAKKSPQNIAMLSSQLDLKKKELAALVKPAAVEMPSNQTVEQKTANEAIAASLGTERAALAAMDTKITAQKNKQKTLTEQIALATKLEGRIANFQAEYDKLYRETSPDFVTLGLSFGDLIKLTIDKKPLSAVQGKLATEKKSVDSTLLEDSADSLLKQRKALAEKIKGLQDKLDAPNKAYQKYQEALKGWETQKQTIEGAAEKVGTLRYYEGQLKYIKDDLPGELAKLRVARNVQARVVYQGISVIKGVYEELFSSVQQLISDSVIIKEGFKLSFDGNIVERDFTSKFFETYISQGVAGSFCGIEKGEALLQVIRDDYDFNKEDDAVAFAEKVLYHLENDIRSDLPQPMELASQLRKHVELKDLYDFVWSFSYLEPEYSLKLDGKDLSHLSPGERGTLLLVFYLLVDNSNNPIVVDQPEENLDSQTVYKLLIPVIKEVKKRRQIIMVTHSPVIAVVCDAEQIIHSAIDRSNKNTVIYTSGSIESKELNRSLIDVLEGTRPAFENRESKYHSETSPLTGPIAVRMAVEAGATAL